MTVNKTIELKLVEPIILEDLRTLVNETLSLAGTTSVNVTEHKSFNPMDWDPATITVRGVAC